MKKSRFLFIILCCLATIVTTAQVPFTKGNLVVCRLGDGVSPLDPTGATVPVFLDEYTTAGVLVQSIALPTVLSGANKPLVLVTNDFNYGGLTLSTDNHFIAIAGTNAAVGTSFGAAGNPSLRTYALIDYNAVINSNTAWGPPEDGLPYSLVTTNGIDMWGACGNIRYTQMGNSTTTLINSASLRKVMIRNGQLYASNSSGTILKIGTGLPTTTAGQSILSGTSSSGGDVSEFVFADMNPAIPGDDVLYVAMGGNRALSKYSLVGTTWTLNGTIGDNADNYMGITAVINGTNATLYLTRKNNWAVTTPNGSGEVVTITDNTGYNPGPNTFVGTPTILVPDVAGTNKLIRGIAMVPTPPPLPVAAKIYLQGAHNTGTNFHKDITSTWASILNANALTQPYNIPAFGNYAGNDTVPANFFQATAATTDILDWVLLELHDATNPSLIKKVMAALVRVDGKIVATDGISNPAFTNISPGNYFLVIRHRNHIAVRSATALAFGATLTSYDFTTSQSQAFQDPAITPNNAAMVDLNGDGTVFGLWGGNANSNANTRFQGLNNDGAAILSALSGIQSNTLSNCYHLADINLDGSVKFQGLNNDVTYLLSILGANQAAVVTQHQ